MGVIIYSFNLNISPKMSYGMLECDIVMLQNHMLITWVCNKSFYNKIGVLFMLYPHINLSGIIYILLKNIYLGPGWCGSVN